MSTAVNFRERMNVSVSNAEYDICDELNKRNLHPDSQIPFCVQQTVPDFYFPYEKIVVYIDETKIHRKHDDRDQLLRERIKKLYGVQVLVYSYDAPLTKRRLKEICDDIEERVQGIRKARKHNL